MFRFRDHIISLVAVFLALGLGILIGTGLSDDMLVTQQRLLIEQMSKDQRMLREEAQKMEARVQSLSRDLYFWEKYQEALYPNVVGGLLADKPVAVIYHGIEVPQDVLNLLRDADAEISSVIGVGKKEDLVASDGLGSILAAFLAGNADEKMQATLHTYIGSEHVVLERFSRNVPQAVVLVLGEKDELEPQFIEEMIGALNQEQFTLVGLEDSKVENSLLEELKKAGISTVDNVDTAFGQFSLLAVLRGSAGNYGIKSAADQFIANY